MHDEGKDHVLQRRVGERAHRLSGLCSGHGLVRDIDMALGAGCSFTLSGIAIGTSRDCRWRVQQAADAIQRTCTTVQLDVVQVDEHVHLGVLIVGQHLQIRVQDGLLHQTRREVPRQPHQHAEQRHDAAPRRSRAEIRQRRAHGGHDHGCHQVPCAGASRLLQRWAVAGNEACQTTHQALCRGLGS